MESVLSLILILYSAYSFLKKQKRIVKRGDFLYNISFSGILGLLLFSFAIMYWMYFGESTLHKSLLNYFFSGAVVLFCILLTAIQTSKTSILRIFICVLVIALSLLLFDNRPSPDYFLTSIFFDPTGIWLMPASFCGFFIPVSISLYLIAVTFYRKQDKAGIACRDVHEFKAGTSMVTQIVVFILGAAGFLVIPLISILKYFFVSSDTLRIKPVLSAGLFVDPEFAYPFFMMALWLLFLFLFIADRMRKEEKHVNEVPGIILITCSLLFFFMLNVVKHVPVYERVVYCFARNSGELMWKETCLEGPGIEVSNYNSQATPTPLINDKSIYAYFGGAGLASFDLRGRLKWVNRDLPYTSPHGSGASPVFYEDEVVVLNTSSDNAYVAAIDDSTGSVIWKRDFPPFSEQAGEYRSPLVYNVSGRRFVVEWSIQKNLLILYDALTGDIASSFPVSWKTSGEAVATPLIFNDIIYLVNPENVVAVDLAKVLRNEPPLIWQTDLNSRGPETASPVYDNGMIYVISDTGFATCLEGITGRVLWQKKLPGAYLSSPVAAGHNIYFSNNSGLTTVVESSRDFRIISRNDLGEGIYATLVPVDGQFFVRTRNSLWCVK